MCTIILGCIGVIGILLYSCSAISTPYDKKIDDAAQEAFLRQYKRK